MTFKQRTLRIFLLLVTWQNTLRLAGLLGLLYLVVYREKPDPTLILALCAMMGLPSFITLDKENQKRDGDKE